MKKKVFVLLFLLLLIPSYTFASSKYISVSDGDVILNDDVNNSYLAVGNNVKINNKVDGIYGSFANTIDYNADNDYILFGAEEINLNGSLKDGALFARNIKLNNVHIRRDIAMAGEEVILSGVIDGNVVIACKKVSITNSTISGNVIMMANEIEVDQSTIINGMLKYNKSAVASVNKATIGKTEIYDDMSKTGTIKTGSNFITYLYRLISLFVILTALYLIAPQIFDKFSNNVAKNFGYGAIAVIGLPIPLLLLLLTRFGFSLAIIVSLLYVAIILLSKVIVGYEIGKFIYKKIFKKPIKKYLCGIVGITVVYLLSICPFINGFITFAVLLYAFGIIVNLIFCKKKK